MIIALGSARAAKIMALRSACARIAATEARWKHVELIARSVETDAPRMPLNDTQLMRGAFGRARRARASKRRGSARRLLRRTRRRLPLHHIRGHAPHVPTRLGLRLR